MHNEQLNHASMLRYWGKADEKYVGPQTWHPLAYHSLDVAAVAESWWITRPPLRRNFLAAFAYETSQGEKLRAWMRFFVALHDLGKFDLRFQLKAPSAVASAWRPFEKKDHGLSPKEITEFDHGHAGIAWAKQEYQTWLELGSVESTIWEHWQPWLAAVTGHHGDFYPSRMDGLALDTDETLIERDRDAQHAFVNVLENLFLQPAGLSLQDLPPPCSTHARTLIAGFCAVCDWIGSNAEVFDYSAPVTALPDYYNARLAQLQSSELLARFGLLGNASAYRGVSALLNSDESPRGIQTEVDDLPASPGLTLIEAPTGSGKTEAALAYAWRLLDAGVADSIVFALPAQATANAVLLRAEAFAGRVFGNANIVLAHGKRQFNEAFQKLAESGRRTTAQGKVEAAVQCAAWLANNPVKTIVDAQRDAKPGKESEKCRVPLIKAEEQRQWLLRKLGEAGEAKAVRVLPHAPLYFRKGSRGGKLVTATFEGVLHVRDPDRLAALLENGVGPAKAFGCGLLLVRRIG